VGAEKQHPRSWTRRNKISIQKFSVPFPSSCSWLSLFI
jgi:hypothetical protein